MSPAAEKTTKRYIEALTAWWRLLDQIESRVGDRQRITSVLQLTEIHRQAAADTRAIVMQHKTKRPVQFEITGVTRDALQIWIKQAGLNAEDFLFPSRLHHSPHLGTRQYARILGHWVDELGLDRSEYGTHSVRRTKATLIYRRTKNLRAVQLLLGHSKLESTVRYLGIEVDDALEISEQTEI
jgi:integrase